jgi:signal transduction histidine kinase
MFNEKNIPKLIILTPIFTIITLVLLILYFYIKTQQDYFLQESTQLENEYIEEQKIILKEEINNIFNYIEYHKNLMITNTKKNMQFQIETFSKQISQKNLFIQDYEKYIKQNKNANSDFLIFDKNTNTLIKNHAVFFNLDKINTYMHNKKNFVIEDETTLYFFKEIPTKNMIVILKKDIFNTLDDLKYSIARWAELIRFKNNNYLSIHTNTNILVAHPYRKNYIGNDDTNKKDGQGIFFVQKFVKLAIKNREGSFVEFFYPKPDESQSSKKLNFVKLYKDWQWVISGGIYLDEIKKEIQGKKYDLEQKINKYIKITLTITLFLIIIISILSFFISQKINKTFKKYQSRVLKNEASLKDLNHNLHDKIELALEEAKKKDRAMLHQSRLARMGEMLSMISHQWRQPLSQLAGIIMELETTVTFKKANEKFLLNCASDATKIIQHMSLTIEDFKNFFKPEKSKENFYISKACEGAISLIKDSLINQNIDLDFQIKNDKKVYSYKREYSQVILNLLVNAKDALLINQIKHGKITLIVDTIDNLAFVEVRDNAGGIKNEYLDLVFEPYFSTKKSHGTGLGLYMSKMIIEQNMQGKISVQNGKKGAIFRIIL